MSNTDSYFFPKINISKISLLKAALFIEKGFCNMVSCFQNTTQRTLTGEVKKFELQTQGVLLTCQKEVK